MSALRHFKVLLFPIACGSLTAAPLVHWQFEFAEAGSDSIASVSDSGITLSQSEAKQRPDAARSADDNVATARFRRNQADCLSSGNSVAAFSFAAKEAFTIEGVFNAASLAEGHIYTIVSNRGASRGNLGWSIAIDGESNLTFMVDDQIAQGPIAVVGRRNLQIGGWYFFSASREPTGRLCLTVLDWAGVYVRADSGEQRAAGALGTDSRTYIARQGQSPANYFDGYIKEIRISTGVRSFKN